MARNRDMGDERWQASDAKPGATGGSRPANAPRLALPTDLGRSLRLLDDEQFDHLEKAVAAEVRRRGRHAAASLPAADALRAQKSGPATPTGSKSGAPDRTSPVISGSRMRSSVLFHPRMWSAWSGSFSPSRIMLRCLGLRLTV